MGDFQYYQYYRPEGANSLPQAAVLEGALPVVPPATELVEIGPAAAEMALAAPRAVAGFMHIQFTELQKRLTMKAVILGCSKIAATGLVGYGVLQVASLSGADQVGITSAAAAVIFGIDSSLAFICAFVLVVEVPLLQHFGYTHYGDTAAVVAFYALAIGVLRATIEYYAETRQRTVRDRAPEVTYRLYR